jgi:hypothetical protein
MKALTDCFEPISLVELNSRAALLCRLDNKYIVDLQTLDDLVDALRKDFLVLEIDERRVFNYETVYFDSPELDNYRAHVQGRRRRFKVRSRRYVDSDLHVFEIKLKGPGGTTDKRQLLIGPDEHATLTQEAERFADGVLREEYGHGLPEEMAPALGMTYRRITLAAKDGAERVTWDFSLSFGDAALDGHHAIVETKTPRGRGIADRALLDFGVRPVSCSKYCAGIGLTRPGVRTNPWARLLRSYFTAAATPAFSAAAAAIR